MAQIYEPDGKGNRVMYHPKNKLWYAYAGVGERVRGEGKTQEEAIENSIYNTKND